MATNNEMKMYDFIEGTEFDGLIGKAIDKTAKVGDSDVSVHMFYAVRGADSMAVVDLESFYGDSEGQGGSDSGSTDSGSTESGGTESGGTESGGTESGGTESGGTESGGTESGSTESGSTESGGTESGGTESGSTESGETEPVIVKPEETENTPEQEQVAQDIANAVVDTSSATGVYNTVAASINNVTMPANAGRSTSISGSVQDGATFVNESGTKYMTITGQQTEPVDVSIVTSGGTVYLRGEYNDIYLEGKGFGISSSIYPSVHGTISIADTDQPVTVSPVFVGDNCGVTFLGDDKLTVSSPTGGTASPTIYAPNASVEVGGTFNELTATVSENTLILKPNFHANKLKLLKGNIFVNGFDINDFVDELEVPEDCVITYLEYHVTQSDNAKLMASSLCNGKIILDSDIELTKGRTLSALASGKELIDLNGHSWKCGDTRADESNVGSFYLRNSAKATIMDSVGGGVFENNHENYLVFANGNNVEVNIMSGEYRGYTHTLYALLGTINVYGGTFKLLDADTASRDANGNLKFLLNCYDANYTAGTAKINVYGGKFYEFNPAVTYGEPNGPVSFVADGYHVVESVEDGKKVYEVVKNN